MVEQLLEQATTATKEQNWSLVNSYLQQLSLEQIDSIESALEIALSVLEYGDFEQRWDVAKIFPRFGDQAIAPLIEMLEDEDAELEGRWFAGRILGQFDSIDVILTLVNLLQTTEDEELAAIATQGLANLGSNAITGLIHLLDSPNTRLLATNALAQICHPDVIPALLSVVKDANVEVRKVAIAALSNFSDSRILPVLIEALNDLAAVVRKEAVIGLGLKIELAKEVDLLSHLQPRLYDFNLEVSQQAAIALGRLGTEKAIATLSKALQSPATPILLQITLIQTLAWIESPLSLQSLEQSLSVVSEDAIAEIIKVLGRIKSDSLKPPATQILLHFFKSEHPSVTKISLKKAIAYTLGQLKQSSAIPVLEKLQNDPNLTVRLHAATALKNC
ncbi:MAG: HEAT repeat domain-containing protein [Chroococcales cyanobacterium]